jgi:CBS-domain-containing membrane protein
MFDALSRRLARLRRRAVEAERREIREFGRWLENTRNLIHLSLLLVVPLVIGLVTWLSNEFAELSFLLFPPLASGAYTLFADPEGRYASPWRFVAGLTVGAVCGWFALELTVTVLGHVPADGVSAVGAAVGIFLAGVATWAFDVEEPAAASTALLVLVTGTSEFAYVVSVAVSSAIVAGAFVVWRSHFYERRARYLYRSTEGDDHVLVPVRGDRAERAVAFGAGLAAAHEAGKVV